jgi:hypothetical protein
VATAHTEPPLAVATAAADDADDDFALPNSKEENLSSMIAIHFAASSAAAAAATTSCEPNSSRCSSFSSSLQQPAPQSRSKPVTYNKCPVAKPCRYKSSYTITKHPN